MLGLITSAPRLPSLDLSRASSADPEWKLTWTALLFPAPLITFHTEHRGAQLTASLLTCKLLIKFIAHIFHGVTLASLLTATLVELIGYNPPFCY